MPAPSPSRSPSPSPPEDIASFMGFSSFGAKPNPPKKKRKHADPTSEGSGSNNIPLGTRSSMQKGQPDARPRKLESMRDQGQVPDSHYGEQMQGMEHQQQGGSGHADISRYRLPNPDPLAAEALDETAALLLQTGRMPRYLDWSEGVVEGGLHDNSNWHGADGSGQVVGQGLGNPDSLAAEARDETAALLLEMGGMPRYLEWGEGFAEGGVRGEGSWREGGRKGGGSGGGGGGGEEMRGVGKRADGEWDWQALRKGVVVDERGDVAFYDGSFVEDPWRGLRG